MSSPDNSERSDNAPSSDSPPLSASHGRAVPVISPSDIHGSVLSLAGGAKSIGREVISHRCYRTITPFKQFELPSTRKRVGGVTCSEDPKVMRQVMIETRHRCSRCHAPPLRP